MNKPTALTASAAVGAGLCLAAACDMRLATHKAKLGWTFATLGLHPGMAATHFTAQILGPQLAARLLLTGEVGPVRVTITIVLSLTSPSPLVCAASCNHVQIINGTKAAELGLVLEAVPEEALMARAGQLAQSIASASPVAVRSLVASLR